LVEKLDAAGASFVSVTQSFNTATSMGRLTLNMLLSFAQFEREVTAERIRDKLAASKAKGLWMGGPVPFGYDKDGRTLKIREDEAKTVRHLFDLYVNGMTIVSLAQYCADKKILSRKTVLSDGSVRGGIPMTRGPINHLLKNQIYRGKITHKGKVFDGQHPAIIEEATWAKAQLRLKAPGIRKTRCQRTGEESLLLGKLVDADGVPCKADQARKGSRRYRYYYGAGAPKSEADTISRTKADALRYSAPVLESAIGEAVVPHLAIQLMGTTEQHWVPGIQANEPTTWIVFIEQVQVQPGRLTIGFTDEVPGPNSIETAFTFRRRKQEQRLVLNGQSHIDQTLLEHMALARELYAKSKAGQGLKATAEAYGIADDKLRRLTQLMFLSPGIIERAVSGTLPAAASARWFSRANLGQEFQDQISTIDALS